MLFISCDICFLVNEIFRYLSWLFGFIEMWLDNKMFKLYDVIDWKTNNCNTHVAQKLRQPDNEGQLIEYNRNIFLEK